MADREEEQELHTDTTFKLIEKNIRQPDTPGLKGGQAIIELTIALVAILVLMTAMLLIVHVGTARTQAMMDARHEAGINAMLNSQQITSPNYIRDWNEGPDGKKLTVDDVPIMDIAQPFNNDVVAHAAADNAGWIQLNNTTNQSLVRLKNAANPSALFGLVKGEQRTSIDLRAFIPNNLLFDSDDMEIDETVWMTYTKGIY